MEGEVAPFALTFSGYFESDPDLQRRYAEQQRMNVNARALGRKWDCNAFAQEVTAMAQFVSEADQIGHTLLLGIAIESDLRMIIAPSLASLLRLDQHSLHCYFNKMGWHSAGPEGITSEQIRDTFGTRVLAAALRFNLKIHYRIHGDGEPTEDSTRRPGGSWIMLLVHCLAELFQLPVSQER
jgi:hypothetical protein